MGGKGKKSLMLNCGISGLFRSSRRFIESRFILLSILFAIALFMIFHFQGTISPDESSNLLLGKKILQYEYNQDFFQRMPLIPFLISLFYLVGFGADAVMLLIPLFFTVLSIPSTYLLAREVSNEKIARITTVLLLFFTEFWRWGAFILADIPMMVFSSFSLYFFAKALKNKKYFYHFGLFLGLSSVTKLTFVILPFTIFLYMFFRKKTTIMSTREFLSGIIIAVVIFSVFFLAVYGMRGVVDTKQLESISGRITNKYKSAITGSQSITYFAQLILFPLLIFLPFAYPRRFRMRGLLAIYSILFLVIIMFLWVVRLRYFSPLYPIIMLFTAQGYAFLRKKYRKITDCAFILLAIVSLLNVFYIISLDSKSNWGHEILAGEIKNMKGLFASDYFPLYLNITNDVLTGNAEVADFFSNFSEGSAERYGVRYIIISIYAEWNREPDNTAYFHPTMGPFEVTFVRRPYSNGRVPPDYTFRSGLFDRLENSPRYEKIREIFSPEGQKIFILYRIA